LIVFLGCALYLLYFLRKQRQKTEHFVVVDNSNIFYGAQNLPGGGKDFSVRLNVGLLAQVIEGGRTFRKKIVGGSIPPPSDKVWDEWKKRGYEVHLGAKSSDGKESFVDDMLHAQILHDLTDKHVLPQKLILVTGDGNDNDGRCSFPIVVRKALDRGWHVEIWSWTRSTSGAYFALMKANPHTVTIRWLDPFRERITFYHEKREHGDSSLKPRAHTEHGQKQLRRNSRGSNFDG